MSGEVQCVEHGLSTTSFVCKHVFASLSDSVPRGFIYSSLEPADEPNAYCADCDTMLQAGGGEWNDELEARAEIKLVCYGCFLKAARLNGAQV
jgi:hypothetical protein